VTHFDEVLGDDRDGAVILAAGQAIEHREDASGRGVLNGEHQPVDGPRFERRERRDEARLPDVIGVGEQLVGRPKAVGMWLALVPDAHDAAEYRLTTQLLPTPLPCGAMAPLLALVAAALAGTGDFLGGFASRRGRVFSVVVTNSIAGGTALLVLGPLFGGSVDGDTLLWGSLAGLSGATAVMALYSGFARSSIGVVSPIAALGGGVWPVVWDLVTGEIPSPIVAAGIMLGLAAIWTISSGGHIHDAESVGSGVVFGTVAGLGFGGMLIFLAMTPENSGIWALLPARFVGAAAVGAVGLALRREILPHREAILPASAAGVLTVLANAAFIIAATRGSLAVVSVLASMFPAATVILARVVFGERLTPQRRAGLAMALIAVGLVAGG